MSNGLIFEGFHDKMEDNAQVLISRKELEQEHSILIARVQQVRRLLGYSPLPTGKQKRKSQK